VRKLVRFVEQIPVRDYRAPRKVRVALRVRKHTLLDYPRLSALHDLAAQAPAGAVVECGAWQGGSAAMMASAAPSRDVWIFDSWEGLPEPGELDVAAAGHRRERGWNDASMRSVAQLMLRQPALEPERVHLVKGWFEATLRSTDTGPIALLHLDCDWYDSVKLCLDVLYDRVVPGGFIAVDDYDHWLGCRRAVDEFASQTSLSFQLLAGEAVYAVKTEHH
jgi:hypothetical protein